MVRADAQPEKPLSPPASSFTPAEILGFLLWQRLDPHTSASAAIETLNRATWLQHRFSTHDGRMLLAYSTRTCHSEAAAAPSPTMRFRLVCGDAGDFDPSADPKPMGSAVLLDCDPITGRATLLNSIVGLPALYVYETATDRIFSSDIRSLAAICKDLNFDSEGLADLCTYGYPVSFRTLFQNVRLVPGGTIVSLAAGGSFESDEYWRFPNPDPFDTAMSYATAQAATFRRVLEHTDVSRSFLSLTAGLDTRTILAELVATGRTIPAFTMSGPNWTIDARAARDLCRAYGIRHEVILLDGAFLRQLPDLVRQASRLSGGLTSLEQSHDVYLYSQLGSEFSARLSGNMGNQLGRKGVEHVSMRSADPSLLNADLQTRARERSRSPWYHDGLQQMAAYDFLIRREAPFTLAGNASIGHYFAVQKSPYARRDLFELCPRQPADRESSAPKSALQLRLNDLRHRFLGQPVDRSFQRLLISQIGGTAATYPINWGWRAKGGVSSLGIMRGALSLVDALAVREHLDSGAAGSILNAAHITGLHEYRNWKLWMRTTLREFVHDILLSQQIRASGIFNVPVLERMIQEHYSDKANHHGALVLALDLGLAIQEFGARY